MEKNYWILILIGIVVISSFVIVSNDNFAVAKDKVISCTSDSACSGYDSCNKIDGTKCYEKVTGACADSYCTKLSSLDTAKGRTSYYCYSTSSCSTGTSEECIIDSHCGTCETCSTSSYTCVSTGDCSSDSDCASDEYCSSCSCVDQECMTDFDCSTGYSCDTTSSIHSCKMIGDCITDGDCSSEYYSCNDWNCEFEGDCLNDSECPTGYSCNTEGLNGTSGYAVVSGDTYTCNMIGECTTDSNCDFGDYCDTDTWTCKNIPETSPVNSTPNPNVEVTSPEIVQVPDEPVVEENNNSTLIIGVALVSLIGLIFIKKYGG